MKKGLLLLLLVSSLFAEAQSLKDALYSGKLKNQPGTVIRKGDDLSTKIDTSQSLPTADSALAGTAPMTLDSATKGETLPLGSAVVSVQSTKDTIADTNTNAASLNEAADAATETATATKNNNELWKEYIDTVAGTLKAEVLSSKKIKKGTYYINVSYTIGTDGQVTPGTVLVTPENEFLQKQIEDRLQLDAPRLNPVLSSTGTLRKVNKRYNFTLTKE